MGVKKIKIFGFTIAEIEESEPKMENIKPRLEENDPEVEGIKCNVSKDLIDEHLGYLVDATKIMAHHTFYLGEGKSRLSSSKGDWEAMEEILKRNPDVCWQYIFFYTMGYTQDALLSAHATNLVFEEFNYDVDFTNGETQEYSELAQKILTMLVYNMRLLCRSGVMHL